MSSAGHEGWPQPDWVDVLSPLLTGEAKLAYYSLEREEAWDCDNVKTEIHTCCNQSPVDPTYKERRKMESRPSKGPVN